METPQTFFNMHDLKYGVRRAYKAVRQERLYKVWPADRECDDGDESTLNDSMRMSVETFHKDFIHESKVEEYVVGVQSDAKPAADLTPND